MKLLVACQIARLAILPRGTEPRGEALQVAMFGRRDWPQLDAQHAPSALARQRAKGRCFPCCRAPKPRPRCSGVRCAGRRRAERPPNHGRPPTVGPPTPRNRPAPATWLRRTQSGRFEKNAVECTTKSNILTQSFGIVRDHIRVRRTFSIPQKEICGQRVLRGEKRLGPASPEPANPDYSWRVGCVERTAGKMVGCARS